MKRITIVSGCYNEIDNLPTLIKELESIREKNRKYKIDFLVIDNDSTDGSQEYLREKSEKDKDLKIILNSRNFGHIRSPYWGIMQAKGDAIVYLASDLQDPPELINEMIIKWEEGYEIVLGVKPSSNTNRISHNIRKIFYKFLDKISEVNLTKNTTGFGLYDKKVIDDVRRIRDPYPYLRGIVDELGYRKYLIQYTQNKRENGITKNNIFTLYDFAMLAIVSHSKVPLRIATLIGFLLSMLSILMALGMLIMKLIWWEEYAAGIAPIGILFLLMFGGVFAFLGVLGEYVISIQRYVNKRPIVIEKERINFDE